VWLFIAWYDFCRPHQSLRVTPAMETRLIGHVWTLDELLTAQDDAYNLGTSQKTHISLDGYTDAD